MGVEGETADGCYSVYVNVIMFVRGLVGLPCFSPAHVRTIKQRLTDQLANRETVN